MTDILPQTEGLVQENPPTTTHESSTSPLNEDPASQTPEKPGRAKRVKKPTAPRAADKTGNNAEASPSQQSKPRRRKAKVTAVKTTEDIKTSTLSAEPCAESVKDKPSDETTDGGVTGAKSSEILEKKKRRSGSSKKAAKLAAEKLTIDGSDANEVVEKVDGEKGVESENIEKPRTKKPISRSRRKGPVQLPENKRLFGMFECTKCSHSWSSANVWKGKKQACIHCNIMLLPTEMVWLHQLDSYIVFCI